MKKIKIAQISDIHWRGSTRHEEYVRAFEELFSQLKEEKVDLIVCTGDTFHTKTQGISPEVVEKLVWMFQELMAIAPVRFILGNHDGILGNQARQDVISPIIKALNKEPQISLYKDSGNFEDPHFPNINWAVFSCFDKDNWNKVSTIPGKTNIALYHGSIVGCLTDSGFRMTTGEENLSIFNDYDFVMMGDIHKFQFMSERQDANGLDKPWVAYPGSMIQQNFGEEENKGYLIWEIQDRENWDIRFKTIPNLQPFITVDWQSNVNATIEYLSNNKPGFLPGSRYRFLSSQSISDIERRQIIEFLKSEKKAEDVAFVINSTSNLENIQTATIKAHKTSLRNNPDLLCQLYEEYLNDNQASHPLTTEQKDLAKTKIVSYLDKLNVSEPDVVARDTMWKIKSLDFDNVFKYGEGNSLDFSKLDGIVGLFAPNRVGKSSLVGTLMYALFNATDRGPVKTAHVINRNASSCRARAHLEINGTDYVVERTSQRDEPKKKRKKEVDDEKTSTSLTITKVLSDGSSVPVTGISRDDSDKELRRLIGTADDFLLTSFASQENMNRFLNEGSTERKAILSRFLDLDIFKKLAEYSKEDCSELNVKTKKYSEIQWDLVIADLKKEIQSLEASRVVLESRILEKQQQSEDIHVWIYTKEKQFDVASISEFEKQLQEKTRQIETLQKSELELKETIRQKQAELLQIELSLQKIDVEALEEKNQEFLRLKDVISSLESSFKVESLVLETQEKSLRKLEVVPCGDMFPQCHFIKDSHENKAKIEEQKRLVLELGLKYEKTKQDLEAIVAEKIAEKTKEHRILSEKKSKSESMLSELRTRMKSIDIGKLLFEKEELALKVQKLKSAIGTSEESELLAKKQQLKSIKEELSGLENQKSNIFLNLGSLRQKLEQSTSERNECISILNDLQIYESIYKAFSKTGIPAMILKSQLPAINKELEGILSGMIDFSISLEADTASNAMDVYIEDSAGKRVIETASGMEKMVASLALRVALGNLSNLPKSNVFILDESFGPLDDLSIHQCMQLLGLLKSYFKTILIITHIAPMKEIADKLIDIRTDGTFSYVMV